MSRLETEAPAETPAVTPYCRTQTGAGWLAPLITNVKLIKD